MPREHRNMRVGILEVHILRVIMGTSVAGGRKLWGCWVSSSGDFGCGINAQ